MLDERVSDDSTRNKCTHPNGSPIARPGTIVLWIFACGISSFIAWISFLEVRTWASSNDRYFHLWHVAARFCTAIFVTAIACAFVSFVFKRFTHIRLVSSAAAMLFGFAALLFKFYPSIDSWWHRSGGVALGIIVLGLLFVAYLSCRGGVGWRSKHSTAKQLSYARDLGISTAGNRGELSDRIADKTGSARWK